MTWLWMIVLAGSLVGCAGTAVNRETTKIVADEQILQTTVPEYESGFEPIDRRAYHYYINGLLFEGLKDLPNASQSFEQAWKFCPESIEIGLSYARSLAQLRNYARAIDVVNQIGPKSSDALLLKALCFRRLGDAVRAKQTYLELLPIDTSNEIAYMYLAGYYQQLGDPDSAVWALTNLARVLPGKSEIQTELGRAHLANGNLEAARDAFRHSIELNPSADNTETLIQLSETFASHGQTDSSLALLQDALKQDYDNRVLHGEIARLWIMRDSIMLALPHLWAVARLTPEDFTIQRRLAIILMATDSLNTADSILTKLITDGDTDPATHFYLGRLAIITKDYKRARDELTIVTRDASNLQDAWLGLGFSYRQLGQPEEEIKTYQTGLLNMREESAAIQLYFALGAAFEQNGQIDSAISTFEEILEHDSDHAATLNYLGYTLADRGIRLEYARELLERAVAMQPNNAAFLDSYGWIFYRLGDFDSAIRYLSSAAELDSDPVIYDHFGDALNARGETERAREWWQKALEQQPENKSIIEKLSR